MPSSISSSEPALAQRRRWAIAWGVALVLALLALVGVERAWRAQGIAPGLIDSSQLWSLQRDRVDAGTQRPVVFLGASRTVYGIDPKVWKQQRPHDKPLMLAINGHYPVAALQDLAADARFAGLAIVDIDSYGLLAAHHAMQQPWLDYYHRQWNFNWRAHRLLLNAWQRASVLSNPGTGLWPTLKRAWSGRTFSRPYSEIDSNRAGWMRFDQADVAGLAAHFDASVDAKIARFPAPSRDAFLAQLQPVETAVAAIRARGGDVVFVNLPVRGRLVEMETRYMPRADYWDAFAARPGIKAIHFDDVPEWASLEFPDRSHVRADQRGELTRGLIAQMERRGWLNP
jgi:hypothetical protein